MIWKFITIIYVLNSNMNFAKNLSYYSFSNYEVLLNKKFSVNSK